MTIDGYAVKFAVDDQGYKDNLMEYSLTQSMPHTRDSYETNGRSPKKLFTFLDILLLRAFFLCAIFRSYLEPTFIELADDELEQSRFSGANSVNIADLDAMQKYMRYWYKKDTKEKELVRGKVPFPKSEEGMRKLTDIALGNS